MDNGELTYEIVEKAIDEIKSESRKPLANGSVITEVNVLTHLIDVIDHQKAEISELQLKNCELQLKNDELKAEIERLERHTKMHDEIKAEAVKEFAESLKEIDLYQFIEEYYENAELRYEVRRDWVDTHIDNLVKEMVGDKE